MTNDKLFLMTIGESTYKVKSEKLDNQIVQLFVRFLIEAHPKSLSCNLQRKLN